MVSLPQMGQEFAQGEPGYIPGRESGILFQTEFQKLGEVRLVGPERMGGEIFGIFKMAQKTL